jgi:multidrug efflux pump subunit AcrB
MKGLIRFSLGNPYAVTVMAMTIGVLGFLVLFMIPVDILPVYRSPAVQVLTFYGGMPARGIEKDITNRMERWTGQANGKKWQESRSILGASIIRNYFQDGEDVNGALTQVNSLALASIPNLPPGTLPPVVLPFDPTSTTPVCLVTLSSPTANESILYDVGRYEVRPMIMQKKGASAPVVIGGKLRAILLYLDALKMQSRSLSPVEVMNAVQRSNLFFPSGDVRIGDLDYALSSNSMYDTVARMKNIPLKSEYGNKNFLGDVAVPRDSAFVQTNVVRVDGKRQVYIPVYRQVGASTLAVVDAVKDGVESGEMKNKLSVGGIDLKVVMNQAVYVEEAVFSLVQEASLGAVLCSLVILLFLGEWRMTLIAVITLPISVLAAIVCLKYAGQTINVMTLAGLTLAIGPMIDSAIICLENTHRYLAMGASPKQAALEGASEVAMPELVSTLCTFLVLSPLALMPGMGKFLFLPMTLAVMFTMTMAYILSRTFVPAYSALLLKPHAHAGGAVRLGPVATFFAWLQRMIDQGIALYVRALAVVLRRRRATVGVAFGLLAVVVLALAPVLRRDFFPEVDTGAFELAVRSASGTRLEKSEQRVAAVEQFIRDAIPPGDLDVIVSEIGLTPDWSSAYTQNSGTQDAVVKVQLRSGHEGSSQQYIHALRAGLAADRRFKDMDFSFDAGGLVRSALNEGKSTPINIQLTGKEQGLLARVAEKIKNDVARIDGVVDARVMQKLDSPELTLEIDRAKAAELGLSQDDVMKNVIAATNSSITYNKRNFWIDPVTSNQYYVGVQYPENKINNFSDILNIPVVSPNQKQPIPLSNVASIVPTRVPTEVHHVDLRPAIDLTMGVEGRDLGHVSDDVVKVLQRYGRKKPRDSHKAWWRGLFDFSQAGRWQVIDPDNPGRVLKGSAIVLSGEYSRMQETFANLGVGLVLASLLIYFLMVGLDRSWVVPLAVMLIVPLCLIGILPMLFITGSAVNVQSLLGFIFIVGIKVANTVLMTDFAQELRRHEGLTPTQAILKAASLRVRPVTMTALAAFFAMIPTAMAAGEANAPLARAILGGLIAGEPATLFVLPALYSLMVKDQKLGGDEEIPDFHASAHGHGPEGPLTAELGVQPS